jgi:cytochrome c-type biogenesis protein
MPPGDIVALIIAPIGFGLLGFIEPCAIGSTLLFIKTTENKAPATKLAQVVAFSVARALFVGVLGATAALVGTLFLAAQKAIWIVVGLIYVGIGALYVSGRIGLLMRSVGPRLESFGSPRGSVALGAILGLNIPACAGPILIALLAASAAGAASGGTLARGFVSLALFGFALSLPLVVAVLVPPARRALDWIAGLSRRIPAWTGMLFIVLGVWSIWFGIAVSIQ